MFLSSRTVLCWENASEYSQDSAPIQGPMDRTAWRYEKMLVNYNNCTLENFEHDFHVFEVYDFFVHSGSIFLYSSKVVFLYHCKHYEDRLKEVGSSFAGQTPVKK